MRNMKEMAHYSATNTMQLGIWRSLAQLTKRTQVTANSVLANSAWLTFPASGHGDPAVAGNAYWEKHK